MANCINNYVMGVAASTVFYTAHTERALCSTKQNISQGNRWRNKLQVEGETNPIFVSFSVKKKKKKREIILNWIIRACSGKNRIVGNVVSIYNHKRYAFSHFPSGLMCLQLFPLIKHPGLND